MNAQSGGGFTAIALMMLVVGMGIPVTAALNATLGTHIQSPVAASTVLFAVGFLLTALVLAFVGLPPAHALSTAPWWSYAAAISWPSSTKKIALPTPIFGADQVTERT